VTYYVEIGPLGMIDQVWYWGVNGGADFVNEFLSRAIQNPIFSMNPAPTTCMA
jgi:hypothetical protein